MKAHALPGLRAAFEALDGAGVDRAGVARRYLEPLAALQDDDLELLGQIELAYYAIYNLYRGAVAGAAIDDWLIVNQALTAEEDPALRRMLLADALQAAQGGGVRQVHTPSCRKHSTVRRSARQRAAGACPSHPPHPASPEAAPGRRPQVGSAAGPSTTPAAASAGAAWSARPPRTEKEPRSSAVRAPADRWPERDAALLASGRQTQPIARGDFPEGGHDMLA